MSSTTTEQPVWPLVKAELARQLPKDIFEMWFKFLNEVMPHEKFVSVKEPGKTHVRE